MADQRRRISVLESTKNPGISLVLSWVGEEGELGTIHAMRNFQEPEPKLGDSLVWGEQQEGRSEKEFRIRVNRLAMLDNWQLRWEIA